MCSLLNLQMNKVLSLRLSNRCGKRQKSMIYCINSAARLKAEYTNRKAYQGGPRPQGKFEAVRKVDGLANALALDASVFGQPQQ